MEMMKTNKLYRIVFAALCIFLALCMGLASPAQLYAESSNITYLSDIKLYYAKSADEAKSGLEQEGYIFQPGNLNNGTDRDTQVYLGYKTTRNADMAITDIRMLGMESGFQLYDYKQMVDYLKNEQSGTAYTMLEAAKEFAQNYEKGNPKALGTYQGLNLFYVDEAEMKLGDYIVGGMADLDFFMSMILKSSAATLNAVLGYLNAGITPFENAYDEEEGEIVSKNWAQQLPESSVYDILENNPTADEIKDMKKQYNDNARETFQQIQAFVIEYENAVARNPNGPPEVSEQTAEEAVAAAEDIEEEDADIVYIEAFNELNKYPYTEDMTVGDWILDIGHQTSDEIDLKELYPLVDVMSDAQNDLVADTGFLTAISNLGENVKLTEFEKTLPDVKAAIKNYNNTETLSVWDSADDDIQSSKIAFTSEAVRRQAANNLVIKHDEQDTFSERFELVAKWVSLSLGIVSVVVFVTAKIVTAIATVVSSATLSSTLASMISVIGVIGAVSMWVGVVVAVATIGILIYLWIKSLVEDEDDPEEFIELPAYVIDMQTGAGGKSLTVKYKTVLANKDYDGNYGGDLNGWEESRWNAICITRDKSVGSPIRMDDENNIFKIVEGNSRTPDGYAPLRPFGERTAGNCNSYCEEDEVGGIYLFYRTEKSINNESPESEGSSTEEKDAPNGYLATLFVATAGNEAQAKAKINKQSTKYYIFDQNLSSGMGYVTYIAYTITMDPKQAITDIRVAPYNGNNSVTYGDAQYIFAGTVGVNMGGSESSASSRNDALMYTTNENAGSPILADSFHVTNSPNDAEAGWEAVTPFACGIPYNFNVTHVSSGWNNTMLNDMSGVKGDQKHDGHGHNPITYNIPRINLYFEPSIQYKSGEKYVSGVFFVTGYDTYEYDADGNLKTVTDHINDYINEFKAMDIVTLNDVNLTESIKSSFIYRYGGNLTTCMGYTYTYNPKRAVYDLALFEGTPYTASLPYSVSKKQADNSVLSYIASTTYALGGGYVGYTTYRFISNLNSFINNQGNVFETNMSKTITSSKHYTAYDYDNVEYGYTRKAFPTVGLYAAGYTKNKDPLRLCDLVITQKEYVAKVNGDDVEVSIEKEKTLDGSAATGAFRSVTDLTSPSSVNAFNFAYSDFYFGKDGKKESSGTHLYLYIRGAAKTKGKYISSIALGAYSEEFYKNGINSKTDKDSLNGVKYSTDMYAMSSACSVSTDEVLIKNLAVKQSDAWYNSKGINADRLYDYEDMTAEHKHTEYKGDSSKQSTVPTGDSSAYIGVTRTDNPKEAITGALLVQNDKWTTEKNIKIGRVVYYCDAIQTPMRVNGHNYYLYYTYNTGVNAGQPIEDISVDSITLIQGAATAICAKDSDVETERTTYSDVSMPSFLHLYYDHTNIKGVFFNKLYIGTGSTKNAALLELAENECVEYMDLDLNDGAGGDSVYFGYRYGVIDQTAINKIKTEEGKEEERRAQLQEAICDIVVTENEPYQPDGFIADNHVYYKPVSDKNLNAGNLGDELYMYYCSDYVSDTYNRKNNAATYRAYDVFSPIKSFALARYDCVPYNTEYAEKSNDSELTVYEYVMCSNEKRSIDLNSGVLVTDSRYHSKGDNRISMFVSRLDNSAKPSAEITGGYVGKTTDVGKLSQYDKEG